MTIRLANLVVGEITSLASLGEAVQGALARFGLHVWWRGVTRSDYELVSYAHRRPYLFQSFFEHNSTRHFIRGARALQTACPGNSDYLDWLLMMQHHGLPTRLLDWTESPYTAAFFATRNHMQEDGLVWAIAPYRFNESVMGAREILGVDHILPKGLLKAAFIPGAPDEYRHQAAAIFAPHTNDRMRVQLSTFTVHGSPQPLEAMPGAQRHLIAFRIPADCKAKLGKLMWSAGIRESILFPDLDHLALDVKTYRTPFWHDDTRGLHGGVRMGTYNLRPEEFEGDVPLLDFDTNGGFRLNYAALRALGLATPGPAEIPPNLGAIRFVSILGDGFYIEAIDPELPEAVILYPPDYMSYLDILRPESQCTFPDLLRGRYQLQSFGNQLKIDVESGLDWS